MALTLEQAVVIVDEFGVNPHQPRSADTSYTFTFHSEEDFDAFREQGITKETITTSTFWTPSSDAEKIGSLDGSKMLEFIRHESRKAGRTQG